MTYTRYNKPNRTIKMTLREIFVLILLYQIIHPAVCDDDVYRNPDIFVKLLILMPFIAIGLVGMDHISIQGEGAGRRKG